MKKTVFLVFIFLSSVVLFPQDYNFLEDIETSDNVVGVQTSSANPSFEGMIGSLNTIHAGIYSTCSIADDYNLYCWGIRQTEANGFGNSTSPTIPMKVKKIFCENLRKHFAARDSWVPMKDFSAHEDGIYLLAKLDILAIRELLGEWYFHVTVQGTVKRLTKTEFEAGG